VRPTAEGLRSGPAMEGLGGGPAVLARQHFMEVVGFVLC
jgi:hypothetical protein